MARPILLVFLITAIGYSACAQNLERLHRDAGDMFYEEDFIGAAAKYKEILNAAPKDKLAGYRYLISHYLTDGRGEKIDSLLAFKDSEGKKDKFYPYWLGRIYFINYDAEHAIKYFKQFLSSKAQKSDEIVSEARQFYKNAELLLRYLRNPDDYEINLVDGINSPYDELSPVFFKSHNELLFASSAPPAGQDVDGKFRVFHTIFEEGSWAKPTPLLNLGEFGFADANLEVVNEDGKLFMYNKRKGGDLFYSEPVNDGWTSPKEFDSEITRTHMQSHFFINSKEDRLIFASDKGKSQGYDLYESYRDRTTGKWSTPMPLPGAVNSPFNEDSPSLSNDEKTLYFSTDRTGFIGGYDVFKSVFDESTKSWGEPENLGFPINSPDDELNFKMNENLVEGYFSSNRIHGAGSFDIYYFWEIEKTNIAGTITDSKTGQAIEGAQIKFHPSSYYDESFTSFTAADGRYGNEIISDEIFTVEIYDKDENMIYNNLMQIKAEGGLAVTLSKDFVIGAPGGDEVALLTNIATKEKEPETTNDFVADAKGKAKVALPSSASEAEEVPSIASSHEGTPDPVRISPADRLTPTTEPMLSGKKRTKLIRQNLYYTQAGIYVMAEYRHLAMRVLDQLQANPSLVIEVAGHTDNLGNSRLNQVLSERRAQVIKKYLVYHGIHPDRVSAVGYGETMPLASNDQEQEGRELNRRVEFFVLSGGELQAVGNR